MTCWLSFLRGAAPSLSASDIASWRISSTGNMDHGQRDSRSHRRTSYSQYTRGIQKAQGTTDRPLTNCIPMVY
jgi:hypothetical protein